MSFLMSASNLRYGCIPFQYIHDGKSADNPDKTATDPNLPPNVSDCKVSSPVTTVCVCFVHIVVTACGGGNAIRSAATIVGTPLLLKEAWQPLGIGSDIQVIPLSQTFGFKQFLDHGILLMVQVESMRSQEFVNFEKTRGASIVFDRRRFKLDKTGLFQRFESALQDQEFRALHINFDIVHHRIIIILISSSRLVLARWCQEL